MPRPRIYATNADRQRAYRQRKRLVLRAKAIAEFRGISTLPPPEKKKRNDRARKPSDEWYTPAETVALVRLVIGEIELDPATCKYAQRIVRAKAWFDRGMNGLAQPWAGKVFLNPPYSYPLVEEFTSKLIQEYSEGRVTEAICVVNNATDAKWFQRLLGLYSACFVKGRIHFYRSDREAVSPRLGQVFFYLGKAIKRFGEVFGKMGTVKGPWEGAEC